jgi:hypothetical protein
MSFELLGLVVLLFVCWWFGWQLYQRLWVVQRGKGKKCIHCGRIYKGEPTYCPHCGEVVAQWSNRR